MLYATIPGVGKDGGFFRSADRGETWAKVNDYVPVDPQYYQEIFPDPHRFDWIYVVDVWIHVSDDGGQTFERLNSRFKHVVNHAIVFDPEDEDYLMVGTDGGIYESWDLGDHWKFIANLPITQFYRVGLDNSRPFYLVYGGTQDNDSTGGPSRTRTVHGIRNSDWFITVGGDGYQTRVDPEDPDILYAMWQYGGLVRYDRKSGERIDIQPQPEADDAPLKWHWDSPLLLSPHDPSRLYFAANRLYRSDDRGDSWRPVSPDLTRQIDRNRLEIMDRVWSVDAVWKNVFTSYYGHIVALDESPLLEGLIYAGTDDGLVQVSGDGGENWQRIGEVPGVPELTYVSDLTASSHDSDTVYASFNNHKQGDFQPYLLKSTDRGATWSSIAGDLPSGNVVWTIVEDHVDANLLFVGAE
ncbi:MAG: glycosyl hydrolase, partial [Acidobacteriota bacterium]